MATIKIHSKAKLKVVEKVVEKLSSNQKKIVEAIAKDPAISAQALAELIGISPRKTQDNIAKLKILRGPCTIRYWAGVRH